MITTIATKLTHDGHKVSVQNNFPRIFATVKSKHKERSHTLAITMYPNDQADDDLDSCVFDVKIVLKNGTIYQPDLTIKITSYTALSAELAWLNTMPVA